MDTWGKTNAEFRNEVNEALARHESSFNQVNNTLQQVLMELQSMRISHSPRPMPQEINPFSTGESSTNRGNHHQSFKLTFPKFDGDDPNGWIYKAEQYYDFNDISADQQVQIASFHMEGISLQWLRWMIKLNGHLTWAKLTKAAFLHFGPTNYEDPSEALTRLRQTSSIASYQASFERLSHHVDGFPEQFLIGSFIAGLWDKIRLEVKIKQPKTLAEAVGVACLVEEKNQLQRKSTTPFR